MNLFQHPFFIFLYFVFKIKNMNNLFIRQIIFTNTRRIYIFLYKIFILDKKEKKRKNI